MKKKEFKLNKKLGHCAFIMDGNGRWANSRGLPRHLGHKAAINRLSSLVKACKKYNIKYMSFYAFSTENWNRPEDEINHLMTYLEEFIARDLDELNEDGARIVYSGDLSRLPESTRLACEHSIEVTKNNDKYVLNFNLNYGGRDEIVRAAKKIAQEYKDGNLSLDEINEDTFKNYLWHPEIPDVDLLIRTSGEQRLSNYMLYELAYAEFVFTNVKWPDFDDEELERCLEEYQTRNRRYGGLKNE